LYILVHCTLHYTFIVYCTLHCTFIVYCTLHCTFIVYCTLHCTFIVYCTLVGVKVRDSDVLAWVWGQKNMRQVLRTFGLLDFTVLGFSLIFHFFRATVNRGKLKQCNESTDRGTTVRTMFILYSFQHLH
jgi:hypothetical protein